MRRREFIATLGSAVAWPLSARAQQHNRIWRIGVLHGVPAEVSTGVAAFRERLAQLGYVEGSNSVIDYRWSDQMDRLTSLAAALLQPTSDAIKAFNRSHAKKIGLFP